MNDQYFVEMATIVLITVTKLKHLIDLYGKDSKDRYGQKRDILRLLSFSERVKNRYGSSNSTFDI